MAAPEDYAVVVGINDYKNPPYGPLEGAKQDAKDFVDWLKSPTGGNLPPQNVDPFTILSNDAGTEPTLSHLWVMLGKIRKVASGTGKKRIGRRLYIFLAGHGVTPPELDESGLVTVEAEESLTTYLAGKENADKFCIASRFDEVLLFMDCCRVSDILIEYIRSPFSEKPNTAGANFRRFYAYATSFGKVSRENNIDGIVRGIFSRALLEGLNGGASPDPSGRLTTTQLRTFLETKLKNIKIDGEEQVPKFPASDEIILAEGLTPRKVSVKVTFSQPSIQRLTVLDGGNNLAPVTPSDDLPCAGGRQFSVFPGRTYLIQGLDAAGKVVGSALLKPEGELTNATV